MKPKLEKLLDPEFLGEEAVELEREAEELARQAGLTNKPGRDDQSLKAVSIFLLRQSRRSGRKIYRYAPSLPHAYLPARA